MNPEELKPAEIVGDIEEDLRAGYALTLGARELAYGPPTDGLRVRLHGTLPDARFVYRDGAWHLKGEVGA